MMEGLSQDQKLSIKEKDKLKKQIDQLEQELSKEEQNKVRITKDIQTKEDNIKKLEQRLSDCERFKKLKDKRKELNEIEKEIVKKLSCGGNTKVLNEQKKVKQKELDELKRELTKTTNPHDANRKKQVLEQVNNFLKAKGDFLTSREEAIKKLENCHNRLASSTNKVRNSIAIGSTKDMSKFENKISKSSTNKVRNSIAIGSTKDMSKFDNNISITKITDRLIKEFQNTLVKNNSESLQLNKEYFSLKNLIHKNKELNVCLLIEEIFKLNSFDIDKYNIFKFATNSQEGARTQLNASMMAKDLSSLQKNFNELKLEFKLEETDLKNLGLN
jgi:hypothetical protein